MKVNVIFEDSECVDIIEVPYNIFELEKIQSDFFKWIFDKNINHKYWIIETAYILKNNTSNYNENDKSLYF